MMMMTKRHTPYDTFLSLIDSMDLASVTLRQLAPRAATLCKITLNDGHQGVQGHSRSLYATSC